MTGPVVFLANLRDQELSRLARLNASSKSAHKSPIRHLKQKAMAPAEIKRFTDRFGLKPLIDTEESNVEGGFKYFKDDGCETAGED